MNLTFERDLDVLSKHTTHTGLIALPGLLQWSVTIQLVFSQLQDPVHVGLHMTSSVILEHSFYHQRVYSVVSNGFQSVCLVLRWQYGPHSTLVTALSCIGSIIVCMRLFMAATTKGQSSLHLFVSRKRTSAMLNCPALLQAMLAAINQI